MQIAGKFLKANRWKIFESFLKAKKLAKFWKQIAGKFLKANRWKFLKANRWKMFESFLKANRWKIFESKTLAKFWKLFSTLSHNVFAMAAVRLERIPLHLREKIVSLINECKSHGEVYRRRTEKKKLLFCVLTTCCTCVTVKTNARVAKKPYMYTVWKMKEAVSLLAWDFKIH